MSESNATSLERLDALLQEGKINREEYETLRGAMASKPSLPLSSSQPRRWAKSWKNRQLGGVCAGIAESLGASPLVVRVIFIVLCLLSLGPLGVLLYGALYFALPWDEEGRPDVTKYPWGFDRFFREVSVFGRWFSGKVRGLRNFLRSHRRTIWRATWIALIVVAILFALVIS